MPDAADARRDPDAAVPPSQDEQRRRLARMKTLATGLLVAMAAVFAATHAWGTDAGWQGYVRAFSEAAMVGALADWFAVTALFRHPLGLPIPHTAIVPRRKDDIGVSLARFVRDNFLVRDALAPRLERLELAGSFAGWLRRPHNAQRVASDAAGMLAWLLTAVDDEALKAFMRDNLHVSLRNVQVTPLIGRVLDLLLTSDRHQRLMDEAVRVAKEQLDENRFSIRLKIRTESPWWMPKFVDEEIYDRIVGEIEAALDRIGTDENHHARQRFTLAAREFIESLKSDPDTIARGEALKEEVLASPAVQAWLGEIWSRSSKFLVGQARDPESTTAQRIEQGLVSLGEALEMNDEARAQINRWLGEAIIHVARTYGDEIASVISETVRAWDAEDTARRIELNVGRDLQFIRINGTIVGGLAGVAIHALVGLL